MTSSPALSPILTLQELEAAIPQDLRFVTGKQEGFVAAEGVEGFYLTFVNLTGVGKNPSKKAQDWLLNDLVPRVEGTSTSRVIGYVETLRRRQGLASRLRSFASNESAIGFEVLDPDSGRRIDFDPFQVESAEAKTIPRSYTYVRAEPKPATRFIFFTEFPFDGIRPDELIVSYPISDEELKLIHEGKTFADLPPELKKPHSLTIHSGDINREIGGDDLVEHFRKTMNGLVAALDHIKSVMGIDPQGSVRGTATDSYLGSVQAKVGDEKVTFGRATEQGTAVRMEVEFQKQIDEGASKWLQVKPERVFGANVAEQLIKGPLAKAAKEVAAMLGKVLKQL